jgi:transposase-like protein
VALKIDGVKHRLWRAVDQTGMVLDVLVQRRRDKQAAKRLLRKLPKKQRRPPRVMITDKLASYGAAKREVLKRAKFDPRFVGHFCSPVENGLASAPTGCRRPLRRMVFRDRSPALAAAVTRFLAARVTFSATDHPNRGRRRASSAHKAQSLR